MVFISPEKGRELSPAESPAERARTPLEVRAVFYERLDHYTVQLMSGRDLKSIERRVRQLRSVVDVDVTYFETSRKDRPWYVLVAGTYTVHSDAESAAATLMVQAHSAWSKKVSKPWVRRVRGVIK